MMTTVATEWLNFERCMDDTAQALDAGKPLIGFAYLLLGLQRAAVLCRAGVPWALPLWNRYASFLEAYAEEVIARSRQWQLRPTGV